MLLLVWGNNADLVAEEMELIEMIDPPDGRQVR